METTLKHQIIAKLEKLPRGRVLEVLDFIEFLSIKTRQKNIVEATDKEILHAIESSGSLNFYYDDSQDVYTMDDGEPL